MPRLVKKSRRNRRYRKKSNVPKNVKKYVKKVVRNNPEVKVHQTQQTLLAVGNSLAITGQDLLAGLSRGVDESFPLSGAGVVQQEMLGLQFRAKYLTICGHINGNTGTTYTSAPQTTVYRLMVVMDNQASNNTQMELYNNTVAYDNLILQTNLLCSPIYMPKTKQPRRCKVLYDRYFYTNPSSNNTRMFKININLKDLKMQFFPTTTSFYELNKRLRFYFVQNTDQSQGSVAPWISYISSLSYTDA